MKEKVPLLNFKDDKKFSLSNWMDFYQKNKPQTNALAMGLMVIVYSGEQCAWGIFDNHLTSQSWASGYEDDGEVSWTIATWFIAAIFGFFVSSRYVNSCKKLTIYIVSSLLALTSATLLIINPSSLYFIFPSRIVGGFAHGLVYIAVLIHASEVAVNQLRGLVVASIHVCFIVGIYITSTFFREVYKIRSYEIDPTEMIGINGVIIICTGIFLGIFFTRESPVFLIRKNEDKEAVNIMIRLRSESSETSEIHDDFIDLKLMVNEDSKSSKNIFTRQNLKSLGIIILLKFGFVSTFNILLNTLILEATQIVFYDGTDDYSPMVIAGIRMLSVLISTFLVDTKRLKCLRSSYIVSSLLIFAISFVTFFLSDDVRGSILIMILGILLQISSGFTGILTDLYSIEAFDTMKKPISIAFISSLEFSIQIIFVFLYFHAIISMEMLVLIMGIILILSTVIAYLFVPETSNMSLRKARNQFFANNKCDYIFS